MVDPKLVASWIEKADEDLLFAKASLKDGPKFGAWWEKHDHRKKAKEYNMQWQEWLRQDRLGTTLWNLVEC